MVIVNRMPVWLWPASSYVRRLDAIVPLAPSATVNPRWRRRTARALAIHRRRCRVVVPLCKVRDVSRASPRASIAGARASLPASSAGLALDVASAMVCTGPPLSSTRSDAGGIDADRGKWVLRLGALMMGGS